MVKPGGGGNNSIALITKVPRLPSIGIGIVAQTWVTRQNCNHMETVENKLRVLAHLTLQNPAAVA